MCLLAHNGLAAPNPKPEAKAEAEADYSVQAGDDPGGHHGHHGHHGDHHGHGQADPNLPPPPPPPPVVEKPVKQCTLTRETSNINPPMCDLEPECEEVCEKVAKLFIIYSIFPVITRKYIDDI